MVRMIDMFPEAVRKKLDFFNKDKYTIATEEVDLKEKKKYGEVCEYSRAVTPQIRQTGNRLSGNAGTAYASLLA